MVQQQRAFGGLGSAGLAGLGLQQAQQAQQAPPPNFIPRYEIEAPPRKAKSVDVSLREELQLETDKALKDILK